MKVFIFGGTTEGRIEAENSIKKGYDVTVSVATDMGAEELKGLSVNVLVGRMGVAQMEAAIAGYDTVIDATHPYATEVTRNIQKACVNSDMTYQRIERDTAYEGDMPRHFFYAVTHAEAAEYLLHTEGNILLTTGSKNLSDYGGLAPERLYARVLPTHEALDLCDSAGIPKSHIIAMHGPFSKEINSAMIREYNIKHLVTKQSGATGGFPEKVQAVSDNDIELVVVKKELPVF